MSERGRRWIERGQILGPRPSGRLVSASRTRRTPSGGQSRQAPAFRAGRVGIIDLTEARAKRGTLSLIGFAIGSSGGPLALVSIYLAQNSGAPPRLGGIVALAGFLLFLAPLAIWLRFSREIASGGGLYAFVREASGSGVAVLHGVLWSVSYLLYLPFTVADIVYLLLPEMLSLSPAVARLLEVGIPVVITAAVASGKRGPVFFLAGLAVAQLAVLGLLVVPLAGGAHLTGSAHLAPGTHLAAGTQFAGGAQLAGGTPFAPAASGPLRAAIAGLRPFPLLVATGGASLLFVCSSLVLYLGGEARGGPTAIRRALTIGLTIVVLTVVPSAVLVGRWLTPQTIASAVPGYALALATTGRSVALLVGIATLASLAGLVVAEFVALTRLWEVMFRFHWRKSTAAIGAFFIAADAVSLINPSRFYSVAIVPSLAALFASQLIVFLVFPLFKRKRDGMRAGDWVAFVVAIAWALYGLYLAIAPSPPSVAAPSPTY